MSLHINADKGQIAEKVLLPGDPLRAQYIAENYLENSEKFNTVRGMWGFTGLFKGERVSIQATGMGLPSTLIYLNELINEYNCKTLIRIGTCGAIHPDLQLKDVVIAQSASTDSGINKRTFEGLDFAPTADFELLLQAHNHFKSQSIKHYIGNILSSDTFYPVRTNEFGLWREHNVLAAEMESSALYTLAAKKNCRALSILTVSDIIETKVSITNEEKQEKLDQMIQAALNLS